MNIVTWLDLYNFLYTQANDMKHLGKFDWNKPVIVHDAETGDEYSCDTYFISSKNNKEKFALIINANAIYN